MKKIFCILTIILAACKQVYSPHLNNAGYNYLVVEGNIIAGNDSTFIHLTRTVNISDTSVVQPELNATVSVESESGNIYPLQAAGNGFYFAPPLNISQNENYRVHIFTASGKEYTSDYVPVKITPPIDSVSWKFNAAGDVNIYVSTHDATDSTKYFQWNFGETWEHRAHEYAELIYDPTLDIVRDRLPEEQVYRCWSTDTSGDILLASTAGLSNNVIFEKQITNIPYQSSKLDWAYSINVIQYALTKQAYEYWENLEKNTEQLGSIFDPQPFADYGNMHSVTDPAEPVLGYISACSKTQQRIYIISSQIHWTPYYPLCKDTLITGPVGTLFSSFFYAPVRIELFKGIHADYPECSDCRLTGGGTTIKPPYMP